MKIVLLSDDFPPKSGGGAAVIAEVHARALARAGHTVIVVTTVSDPALVGESGDAEFSTLTTIRLHSSYPLRFRAYLSLHNPFILPKIKAILQKEKPDVVHVHNIHMHISYRSLLLAKKYAKAVFITIHDSMPFHYSKLFPNPPHEIPIKSYKVSALEQMKDFGLWFNPFKNGIVRRYLKIPHKIFAVSGALKQALADNGINNCEVVHNGIDLSLWQSDTARADALRAFREKYQLEQKKVILFCGRLSRAKGSEALLQALPEIIEKVPTARVLVVGEKDKGAEDMLTEAKKRNLEQAIIFTGKMDRSEIVYAYQSADLLVVPSVCFDWFPTVNLEAMTQRLPIVATCFGGSSEAVSHGKSGYIVNPYKPQEISESVIKILTNETQAKAFGEAGYQKVEQELTLNEYLKNTLTWYHSFL